MATKPRNGGDTKTHDDDRKRGAPAHGQSRVTGAAAGADHEAEAPRSSTERTPEELAQLAASSIGAQVILDYNGDGSLGARGGAGSTIEENSAARDAHLISIGLDPQAPSGPPTGEPWEPPVQVARQATGPAATGKATRVSRLAAGILTAEDAPGTGGGTPPGNGGGGGEGAAAPANTAPPVVTQSGETLTCTQGTWSGEPTSYGYRWTIDGAAVGTDAATHTVTTADAGKTAACVVTATNAGGSAPVTSADVTLTDPAGG